jgi:hypothetical protein
MSLNQILIYIDPGTGSIILQAIVAGVAGVSLFIKYGWRRMLRFFGIKKGDKNDSGIE